MFYHFNLSSCVVASFFFSTIFISEATATGCCQFKDQAGTCNYNSVAQKNHCVPPYRPSEPRCANADKGSDCFDKLTTYPQPTGNCPQGSPIYKSGKVACNVSTLTGFTDESICNVTTGKCVTVNTIGY